MGSVLHLWRGLELVRMPHHGFGCWFDAGDRVPIWIGDRLSNEFPHVIDIDNRLCLPFSSCFPHVGGYMNQLGM
jgi:hypothetical protein